MAAAMAALLVFELHQSQSIQEGEKLRVNAITTHSVLLDREFLRFRQALSNHLYDRRNPDLEVLELRINVLNTRVDILRQSPAAAFFFVDAKNQQTLTRLENLLTRLYDALQAEEIDKVSLVRLLQEADELNPDVMALGNSAEAVTASLLEKQGEDILRQNKQITILTLGLLVLFVIAAMALYRRDLTQAKEHEEVRKLVAVAQQASRGKSQFLANMSHELRTPFNSILGMLQLLQTTGLNEVQADYVRTASGSASHLLTILNDILDLSALEAGKMNIQPQPFDLILMDIHMPVMDGITCTRAVRNLPYPVGETPIVVISADVMNDAKATALAAGVNDFISKPLQMSRLHEVMQKYLNQHI